MKLEYIILILVLAFAISFIAITEIKNNQDIKQIKDSTQTFIIGNLTSIDQALTSAGLFYFLATGLNKTALIIKEDEVVLV
jgi:arabinogalactan endo-1,4-beta-galactosidase